MNRIISVTGALSIYVAVVYSVSLCLSANKKARQAYREAYVKAVEDAWFTREETLDRVENEVVQLTELATDSDNSIYAMQRKLEFAHQHLNAIRTHLNELREPRPESLPPVTPLISKDSGNRS